MRDFRRETHHDSAPVRKRDVSRGDTKRILVITAIVAVISIGSVTTITLIANSMSSFNPIIDGRYTRGDWEKAGYFNVPFWLDLNNTVDPVTGKRNVNGWNYISIGDDGNYYYVGLDLCSDRTNRRSGEWLGVYLANRMPQVDDSIFGLQAMRDDGLEFINFNVMTNKSFNRTIKYEDPSTWGYIPVVPYANDTQTNRWGNVTGDYKDYWQIDDGKNMTVASVLGNDFNATPYASRSNYVMVDFCVDLEKKFPRGFEENFIGNLTSINIQVIMTGNKSSTGNLDNSSADDILAVIVADSNPMDISKVKNFSSIISADNGDFCIFTAGNYSTIKLDNPSTIKSSDNKLYFSLFAWNEVNRTEDTAFEIYIDSVTIEVETIGFSAYKDTSVGAENYDMKYNFGTSFNSNKSHGMYELRVAKKEFPADIDGNLHVFIAGYGDMTFGGMDLWFYPFSTYTMIDAFKGVTFPVFDSSFASFDMKKPV